MTISDCPLPLNKHETIQMAHGGGGRLMNDLLRDVVMPALGVGQKIPAHDGAYITPGRDRLAFTTDSYVVKPLFFPGGDIGALAVNGTINDLAMCGAKPLYLSCGLIMEEGFPIADLKRILQSMDHHAKEAGVEFVTGDTKVVDCGKGDGVFINTAGIGLVTHNLQINPMTIAVGDVLIVSGDLGRHAVAVMAAREGFAFEHDVMSDTTPLHWLVDLLISADIPIHCLRDLTRGGLATVLVELAEACGLGIKVYEQNISVTPGVRGACEILGLDPWYLANEGRFIAVVSHAYADQALRIMRSRPEGINAAIIGEVTNGKSVTLINRLGTQRLLSMLSGEQLPRIC